jgi:hypothetical protein
MEKMANEHRIYSENLNGRDHLEDKGVHEGILLK